VNGRSNAKDPADRAPASSATHGDRAGWADRAPAVHDRESRAGQLGDHRSARPPRPPAARARRAGDPRIVAVRHTGGNMTAAAELLGMSAVALRAWIGRRELPGS
jgi:hypothetical protein